MKATPCAPGAWSAPADIRRVIERQWERGLLLAKSPDPGLCRIALAGPTTSDLTRRLPDVQAWIRSLEGGRGLGYEVIYETRNLRQLGENRIPTAVLFASTDAILDALNRRRDRDVWLAQIDAANDIDQRLGAWVIAHPLRALEQAGDWERLLAVVKWLHDNPGSRMYLRQIDLPGIHTKFIESNAGFIRLLSDQLLPAGSHRGPSAFTARFGLRDKEGMVQLRALDPSLAIGGLTHVAATVTQLRQLALRPHRVIITENEVNGLSLPPLADAVAIFGRGYAVDVLRDISWIVAAEVHYWGDIDTHGYAILDRLRAGFPTARSFLMDQSTLLGHADFWDRDPTPTRAALTRLSADEDIVYRGLLADTWGPSLRLEQERIHYKHVLAWADSLST
jgi:hypothetical protein